tara:strand:- start:701 stop:811 length:111 start_codon:yes stop_codon:yes gene_type:complete
MGNYLPYYNDKKFENVVEVNNVVEVFVVEIWIKMAL